MSTGTKYCHPSYDASKMLEAALQQMDGIIAGAQMELASLPDRSLSPPMSIVSLCEKLKVTILSSLDDHEIDEIDEETRNLLLDWLTDGRSKDIEERLSQLEGDKESLQLQVSILSEQVEVQSEKLHDLEVLLEQKKAMLFRTEEHLHKEVIMRSSLETQRLELLSEMSNLKLHQAAFEKENSQLRDQLQLRLIGDVSQSELKMNHCGTNSMGLNFNPAASSTPLHRMTGKDNSDLQQPGDPPFGVPQPFSTINTHNNWTWDDRRDIQDRNARDWLFSRTPPPNARRKIEQFGTIPRQLRNLHIVEVDPVFTAGRVAFGKGFTQSLPLRGRGKRSSSAPNLAETEKTNGMNGDNLCSPNWEKKLETPREKSLSPLSPSVGSRATGFKKIFTKLRRSGSGHINGDVTDGTELKRGGLRATAAARLGWTSQTGLFKEPPIPFISWTPKHVEEWLGNLGLRQYGAAARSWMERGNHIAKASPHHLEKDIGIRHPLHRKKLQLTISRRVNSTPSPLDLASDKLDTAWVLRWLDDLALPQYKDVFIESRVNGLVLNYLTYDDLAFMKINNLLHVTSLKRGLQVLRKYNFDPSVLKRRSSPDEEPHSSTPEEVALWTNHRVMEWLKTVDLAEYAPNLRGSGVHGALFIYEARFTAECLAALLSISSSKTLLRRHLNTHFKELVGMTVIQIQREVEVIPGYIPLSASTKIKMPRKSQFSLKRRKNKEVDYEDLLCSFNEELPCISQFDASTEVRVLYGESNYTTQRNGWPTQLLADFAAPDTWKSGLIPSILHYWVSGA